MPVIISGEIRIQILPKEITGMGYGKYTMTGKIK
jgi:hypothetical protein